MNFEDCLLLCFLSDYTQFYRVGIGSPVFVVNMDEKHQPWSLKHSRHSKISEQVTPPFSLDSQDSLCMEIHNHWCLTVDNSVLKVRSILDVKGC